MFWEVFAYNFYVNLYNKWILKCFNIYDDSLWVYIYIYNKSNTTINLYKVKFNQGN